MLKLGVFPAGVAAGVLFGFESEENRAGLGGLADALLLCSAGFRLANGLLVAVGAVAAGFCADTELNSEVVMLLVVTLGRLANGLPAEAVAGALVVGVVEPEVLLKRVLEGASLFCAAAPKLNRFVAGAVVVVLVVPCALVPKPLNKLLGGFDGPSSSFALEPNPLNRLFCVGAVAAAVVEAGVPKPAKALFVAGAFAAWVEVAPPKVKVGAADAGVLELFGAEVAVPNMLLGAAPLVVPNMLV